MPTVREDILSAISQLQQNQPNSSAPNELSDEDLAKLTGVQSPQYQPRSDIIKEALPDYFKYSYQPPAYPPQGLPNAKVGPGDLSDLNALKGGSELASWAAPELKGVGLAAKGSKLLEALAALKLAPTFNYGHTKEFRMFDDVTNKPLGSIMTVQHPRTMENVHIANLEAPRTLPGAYPPNSAAFKGNPQAWALGRQPMKEMINELWKEYPDANKITGWRSSGSAWGPAGTGLGRDAVFRRPKPKEPTE